MKHNVTKRRGGSWWLDVVGFVFFAAGASLLAATIWEIQTLNVGLSKLSLH